MFVSDVLPPSADTSAQVEFLLIDAALGLTCARLAMQAEPGSRTRIRHLTNAKAVWACFQHHSSNVALTSADAYALDSTLRELAALLNALQDEPARLHLCRAS